MIRKTRTALEAGFFGSRVLGMPGPMGTRVRETTQEKYRERSRQAGNGLSASPVRGDKIYFIKKDITWNSREYQEK